MPVATTHLGRQGPQASRIGLGAMALSGTYGPAEDEEGIATIHAALEAGINLIDDQLAELEQAVPVEAVAVTRYAEAQMAHLDSER